MNYQKILDLLQCPRCGGELFDKPEANRVVCQKNESHQYPVVNGIIRFVELDDQFQYNTHWSAFNENPINEKKLEAAEKFMDWFLDNLSSSSSQKIFLDVGCGDGNFLPFIPEDGIKIALDYSNVVDLVAKRYEKMDNLFLLQADAQNLPLKAEVVDYLISYGCLNCIPNLKRGMIEVARVLKRDGYAGIWGYGTKNTIERYGFAILRTIYHSLGFSLMQTFFTYALIPVLLFVDNSTGIKPGNNSLKECAEIISTNLAPESLHLFYYDSWRDFAPPTLQYVDDFELSCGQKFSKGTSA